MTSRPTPQPGPPARPDRRRGLWLGVGLGAGLWVRPALAEAPGLQAAIRAFCGGALPQAGRVRLEVAPLVDNGNAVPLTVQVDSPMSERDHVVRLAVFNELNPQREVIIATLGPHTGVARLSTRIRLATSQQLVAVARLSDGSHWSHSVDVIVTLAACLES